MSGWEHWAGPFGPFLWLQWGMAWRTTLAAAVFLAASSVAACDGSPLPTGGQANGPAVVMTAGTSGATQSETTAQAQCPPDVSLPIPTRICPAARESGTSKLMGTFPEDGSPVVVVVQVSGGALVCDVGSCRDGNCPLQMATWDYWEGENFASQRCVRDLIASVGGTATSERFWLVDMLVASLTWEQIRTVAMHPHVTSIAPNQGGPPP
jgi:hypothetical protein